MEPQSEPQGTGLDQHGAGALNADDLLKGSDSSLLLNGTLEVRIDSARKLKGRRLGCGLCCPGCLTSSVGCCRLGGLANPVVEVGRQL